MFPPHFTCLYAICVMQTLRCSNPESDSVKRSKKLLDKHPARPLPLLSSTEGSVMPVHPTGDCRREIEFVGESSFCILIQVCYLSRERVERGGGIGWRRSFALALAFHPSLPMSFFVILSCSLSWLGIGGHHFYISPLHLTLTVYLCFWGRANSEKIICSLIFLIMWKKADLLPVVCKSFSSDFPKVVFYISVSDKICTVRIDQCRGR